MELIKLEALSKSYYSTISVTQALRHVSLSFYMGEFVAITGESGSGKSTLLNIIAGLLPFDDGEMYVEGEPTFPYDDGDWEEYRRKKIGFVFQDYNLIGHYSALENVISAMLITGMSKADASQKALEYLEKVGLGDYATHKASELSSGQKQRLSIARALAKETKIILADEPTGNLDSETGEQIMELLEELSKERLVIMVTHNLKQAEKYVSRQIRIHDGEVVNDITLRPPNQEETKALSQGKPDYRELIGYFSKLNVKSQKGRSFMFKAFFLVISLAAFIFIGQLAMHSDDRESMTYSDTAFKNGDDTRLIVKKSDDSALTQEDFDAISAVNYVTTVDSCDLANDINYYMTKGEDYEIQFGMQRRDTREEITKVKFLDDSHFVKSTDCIDQSDLTQGALPEGRKEIVVASQDSSLVGTTVTIYFRAPNIWDTDDEYYCSEFEIVGLVKGDSNQVYFASDFCKMLSADADSDTFRICYNYNNKKYQYDDMPELVLVIGEDLTGTDARVSSKLASPVVGEVLSQIEIEGQDTIEGSLNILEETNESSGDFIEVSKEVFDSFYDKETYQYSVYIVSYAKTDSVIKKLNKLGYQAISAYRTGMTEYDEELVRERFIVIGICTLGLVVLFVAMILILQALLRTKRSDYLVLKSIGLDFASIKKIVNCEMLSHLIKMLFFTVIIMEGLRFFPIPIIKNMMWYWNFKEFLIWVIYSLAANFFAVGVFTRAMKKRA